MGAMATMTGEGVPAANAATYLRQTIMSLENPTKKTTDALTSVGLSSKQVAAEMQKSVPGAMQEIADAVSKKFKPGSAEYLAAMANIAGSSKTAQGILDLTGDHLKTFKDNVAGIGDSVKKGANSINGWSDVQNTFNFKMAQAQEAVEVLMIKIGQKLLPVVGNIVSAITPVITKFTDWITTGDRLKQFLDNNTPGMVALKIALVALAGVMGGLMVAALAALAIAAWAAIAPFLVFAAPFIAIGAIVALVIAGIILAITHWGQIVNWLKGVWGGISGFFSGIWGDIVKVWGGMGQWFQDRFTEAKGGITAAFGNTGSWFGDRWKEIQNTFKGAGQFFHDRFQEAWNEMVKIFIVTGQWWLDRWNSIVSIFKVVGQWFHDRFNEAWNNIVNIFIQVKQWLQPAGTISSPSSRTWVSRFMTASMKPGSISSIYSSVSAGGSRTVGLRLSTVLSPSRTRPSPTSTT